MANIGSFKKSGQEFQGEIVTLSLQTKGVRIVPETDRTNDNAPSHRVYVGRADYAERGVMRSSGCLSGYFCGFRDGRAPHNPEGRAATARRASRRKWRSVSATRRARNRSRPRRGWRRSVPGRTDRRASPSDRRCCPWRCRCHAAPISTLPAITRRFGAFSFSDAFGRNEARLDVERERLDGAAVGSIFGAGEGANLSHGDLLLLYPSPRPSRP